MEPDLWTAFVFFGIPLVVGLLGVHTGGKLCYRAYVQYTTGAATQWEPTQRSRDDADAERTWRGNVLRGGPVLVGATLLTLHSARWVLRIFGLP
ncbi:hypothetical protein [Salinibaculum rarum]|uniref:hypothetical protein n=1 Tax=Salinibaculum rarum TaxID=3058903 RepID=UPI00265DB3D2|nr:hypothetical protein [Salinibaculum sp. KK48]